MADRLAAHPSIPPENREAMRETARSVLDHEFRRMFGGELLQLYVPKIEREQRDARIAAALEAGADPKDVAKREALTDRHVRRLRGRIGGGGRF